MVEVILKYGSEIAFWNRMAAIGRPQRTRPDGSIEKAENQAFRLMTPPREDVFGNFWLRWRMEDGDAETLPPENNPAFSIQWRSDVFVDEELLPEPEMEVENFDINGPNGTRMQRVGGFGVL